MSTELVHHHAIIDAVVRRDSAAINLEELVSFLLEVVRKLDMQRLFEPVALRGKFGFTGIVGIVTSHVAFHYFEEGRELRMDVYSCKAYNLEALIRSVDDFWGITSGRVWFLDRERGTLKEQDVEVLLGGTR